MTSHSTLKLATLLFGIHCVTGATAYSAPQLKYDLVFRTGPIVPPGGVAIWGNPYPSLTFDMRDGLDGPTVGYSGVNNGVLMTVPSTTTPWDKIIFRVIDGPPGGAGPAGLWNGAGGIYPTTMSPIEEGTTGGGCFGDSIYPNAACAVIVKRPVVGYYALQLETRLSNATVGITNTAVWAGPGSSAIPAPDLTVFRISGVSDGTPYSYGLSMGAALADSTGLTTLTTTPTAISMPALPIGSPPSAFVAAIAGDIPVSYPGLIANIGLDPTTFDVDTPAGEDFFLWFGNTAGTLDCKLGAYGSCSFNPTVRSSQSEYALFGLDLENDKTFGSDPLEFGTSYRAFANQSQALTGLDYDAEADTLWAVTEGTHEYGVLHVTDGNFFPIGVLSTLPATALVTGLSADPEGSAWFLSTYDPGTQASVLWAGDITSGTFTSVGLIGAERVAEIAVNRFGDLFGLDTTQDQLISVNTATGSPSTIGPLGLSTDLAQGLDFDWTTGVLYANVYGGTGQASFASINTQTGAANVLADNGPANRMLKLAMGAPVRSEPIGTSFCHGQNCPCANQGGPSEGCANSSGTGANILATGSSSIQLDDLAFASTGLPPNKPTLLFSGTQAVGGGQGVWIGDGLFCAGGLVQRYDVIASSPLGVSEFPAGLAAQNGWSAGESRIFQVWYRDPGGSPCGGGFNFSSAFQVEFSL